MRRFVKRDSEMEAVNMDHSPDRRILLSLVLANFVTSILHYVDNVLFFRHYPEPTWLNPHLVDMA